MDTMWLQAASLGTLCNHGHMRDNQSPHAVVTVVLRTALHVHSIVVAPGQEPRVQWLKWHVPMDRPHMHGDFASSYDLRTCLCYSSAHTMCNSIYAVQMIS